MIKTIVTHSGAFHIDDIFAVATLLLKYPNAKVIRSRNEEVINSADIVVDVGFEYDPAKRKFDHHQEGGAGVRVNGIPYASFGLIWKEFGEDLAGSVEAAGLIEEKLVMPIDAPDNGISTYEQVFENISPYTLYDFLYSFVKNGERNEEYLYSTFVMLVRMAGELIEREIEKAKERVEGMKEVRKILEDTQDKRIVVLNDHFPWEPVLTPIPEVLFVVYPRREGNWGVKGIPSTVNGFERKKYFPLEWAGKGSGELRKITGVGDAVFCHRGRWVASAASKEGAIKLAEIALEN